MPEKKMNWGTLILGIIIGAIVVGVVWFASKPDATGAAGEIGACVKREMQAITQVGCFITPSPDQDPNVFYEQCIKPALQQCIRQLN